MGERKGKGVSLFSGESFSQPRDQSSMRIPSRSPPNIGTTTREKATVEMGASDGDLRQITKTQHPGPPGSHPTRPSAAATPQPSP